MVAVRVVVAEDSVLLRAGIVGVLEDAGLQVVGQAGDLDALRAVVSATEPDVVVADIRMPPTHTDEGLRAAAWLRQRWGGRIGVIILSQHLDAGFAVGLIEDARGGVGYLLKDRVADVDDLVDAIRVVAGGGSAVDPEIVRALMRRRVLAVLAWLRAGG